MRLWRKRDTVYGKVQAIREYSSRKLSNFPYMEWLKEITHKFKLLS